MNWKCRKGTKSNWAWIGSATCPHTSGAQLLACSALEAGGFASSVAGPPRPLRAQGCLVSRWVAGGAEISEVGQDPQFTLSVRHRVSPFFHKRQFNSLNESMQERQYSVLLFERRLADSTGEDVAASSASKTWKPRGCGSKPGTYRNSVELESWCVSCIQLMQRPGCRNTTLCPI